MKSISIIKNVIGKIDATPFIFPEENFYNDWKKMSVQATSVNKLVHWDSTEAGHNTRKKKLGYPDNVP
jgi:hypothetical protein